MEETKPNSIHSTQLNYCILQKRKEILSFNQMDMFFNHSNGNYSEISTPYLFHGSDSSQSSSDYVNSPESISSINTDTTTTTTTVTFSSSDGEDVIILASDCPKKRAGRKKFKETRHPVYRGIRKRNNDKWVCELREPNKKTRIWLGTYSNPEMAARAHDVAAIALRGKSACLNFADSVWRLPVPVSLDAKDIRKAAAEAAKAFADDEPQQQSEVEEVTSRNECIKKMETPFSAPEKVFYMDEEAVFEMPRLLADMAEGLLLSPPCYSIAKGFNWNDQVEYNTEVSLWNY